MRRWPRDRHVQQDVLMMMNRGEAGGTGVSGGNSKKRVGSDVLRAVECLE